MCQTPDETPKTEETQPAEEPQDTGKPTITYDDFCKLDLKIGTIVEAGSHPNADRLIVLQVDIGTETRQIIAGIKTYYEPETLVGKQIVVVTNLAPRKMRGMESNGMLLAASAVEGDELQDVVVLSPSKTVPAGSSVS
ncbi:MAG: methionine--tRNA ligase subunit beta [Phycisphaerae bacterium]|jgi:methionyl-tRNA synthetase|nr:methionine--tRNA ligase subunit beta [Phycisphaerae bacterium]|tara:strand:- start:7 stop:420 length:414 start_codon:yes stop_codon:yes gene_type:complete